MDFTPEEEALLKRSVPNTAKLTAGQLEGYEEAYRPTNLHGRIRMDDLHYEAIIREINRRKEAINLLRRHVHGAPNVHFGDPRERHAAIGRSVHRLSDEELDRRLKIYLALGETGAFEQMDRQVKTDLMDVAHEIRSEIEYRRKKGS